MNENGTPGFGFGSRVTPGYLPSPRCALYLRRSTRISDEPFFLFSSAFRVAFPHSHAFSSSNWIWTASWRRSVGEVQL